jgi:hypothetical protein
LTTLPLQERTRKVKYNWRVKFELHLCVIKTLASTATQWTGLLHPS